MKINLIYVFMILIIGLICFNRSYKAYNKGYRAGMSYAYDYAVICNADIEREGLIIAEVIKNIDGAEIIRDNSFCQE